MQQIKNLKIRILMYLSILGVIFGSCDSLIFDDLADCPQGVYVKFYSMTPCDTDSTFIGSVADLAVFAFDDNGKLAMMHREKNASLTNDFQIFMPVSNGNFTFVAWAGVFDQFLVEKFTTGITTKQDVMMTLKMNGSIAAQLGNNKVLQGESRPVNLPDPAVFGSQYGYAAVNLLEVTNRIKLVVEFNRENIKDKLAKDLNVQVTSSNSIMNINGTMKRDIQPVEFPAFGVNLTDDAGEWNYTLLDPASAMSNRLRITFVDEGDEKIIFDGDLIDNILVRAQDSGVNFDCENDFVVRFEIKEYCEDCWSHFTSNIFVNNWLVHSYSSDMWI